MYRSLMFKKDPLAEQIQKYQKRIKEAFQNKNQGFRKNKDPSNHSKSPNTVLPANLTPTKLNLNLTPSKINQNLTPKNGQNLAPLIPVIHQQHNKDLAYFPKSPNPASALNLTPTKHTLNLTPNKPGINLNQSKNSSNQQYIKYSTYVVKCANITTPSLTPPKTNKLQQNLSRNTGKPSPDEKMVLIAEEKQKTKFKIHNLASVKNDNFFSRYVSPEPKGPGQIKKTQRPKDKNQNWQNIKAQQKKRFYEDTVYGSMTQDGRRTTQESQYDDNFKEQIAFKGKQRTFNNQKNYLTNQNGLKSTLYESIDLGDLLEKIEAKIDLSKKNKNEQRTENQANEHNFTEAGSKHRKIIEKLRSQLNSQASNKQSSFSKQCNLKNLFQTKNSQAEQKQQFFTPQFSAYTAQDNFFPKTNDIDTMINSLNNSEIDNQKTWVGSTTKKSSVIHIDDKGKMCEKESISRMKKRLSLYQNSYSHKDNDLQGIGKI